MAVESPAQANGLKTAIDTIIAPKEAFEALRDAPTWGWALLLFAILFVAGYALQRPAALHASVGTIQHMIATNSMFSSMTDAQKAKMLDDAQHPSAMQTITGPLGGLAGILLAVLLNAVVLLIASSLSGGSARFSNLWAASMNIAVPTLGLSAVVLGIICILRGPDSFSVASDLVRAVPNLGMVVPGVGGKLGAMLDTLSVFPLWGLWLNMQILRWTAGLRGAIVWIVPAAITILGAVIAGFFLSFAG